MHHQSYVRFVDPHSKGIGAGHHPYLVLNPLLLAAVPFFGSQTGMIRRCRDAMHLQQLGNFVRAFAAFAVHDGRTGYFFYNVHEPGQFRVHIENAVGKIFPFERLPEDLPGGRFFCSG